MSREHTITEKIETPFGSLYTHVSDDGHFITEVRFSSPGKFSDTTMGAVLDALGDAVTAIVTEHHLAKKAPKPKQEDMAL